MKAHFLSSREGKIRGSICLEEKMTKEDLLTILKKLLRTERSLDFLQALNEEDVRTLIVCIRDRLDRESRDH
jgi:hypothetical protein